MERSRKTVAEGRAHTDASLGAERKSSDAIARGNTASAQRILDDLIERDRNAVDERLLKFRERSDRVLARERVDSPVRDSAVADERREADHGRSIERQVTDALLERERLRADAIVEEQRRAHEADRLRLEVRRGDTDDQLSTERTGADVALVEAKTALANAHVEQVRHTDVLGMVTHDLRSPLCVIAMNARNLAETTDDAWTRESAQDITRAAARMERLLTDLLDVARIESGTLRIDVRSHDVGALVTELLHSYQPLFAERHIAFAVKAQAATLIADFDHDRMVQVLSNLLGNAMKFTPAQGKVELTVELKGEVLEFAVSDTGPGIRNDDVPHVFKRFWGIDSNARRGLGLGLYICEKIIHAHDGTIALQSELGAGTTVRFTIPRGRAPHGAQRL